MKPSAILRPGSKAVVWISLLRCALLVPDLTCGDQLTKNVSLADQQRLETPFAKSKEYLLREFRRPARNRSDPQAIADFGAGLAALAHEQYPTAQKAFDRSFVSAQTYAAIFNRALTEQLMADFGQAEKDYLQAQSIRQDDPELLSNLAVVYERLGQWDHAVRMFGDALAMARSQKEPLLEGRVALQFALAQYDLGEIDGATRSLDAADAAFGRVNATIAREVVAAKRANILIKRNHAKEGEQLFQDVIGRLHALGAQYEEANARIDLSGYYLDSKLPEALAQLSISLTLCQQLAATDLLGRTLNNRGIYYLRSSKPGLAEADFKSALAKFKQIWDWTGQGEALNNLGALAAQNKNVDLATDYLRDSARAYQKAGKYGRAFDKLLALGKTFDQAERFEEAAEAFTEAAELNSKLQNWEFFTREGLAIAHHDLISQRLDEAEVQIAVLQASCSKVQDTNCLAEASALAHEVRIAYILRIFRWIGVAGLLAWLTVELYRRRRKFPQFARPIASIAKVFVVPIRVLTRGYLRFRHILEGPSSRASSPDEQVYLRELENARRWFLRISMALITIFAAVMSFVLVTRPQLDQLAQARSALVSWPLPWKLHNSIWNDLSQLRLYVVANFLLQLLLFLCWLGIGLVIFDLLEVTIRRSLRYVSKQDLGLKPEQSLDLAKRERTVRIVNALILTAGVSVFAFLLQKADEATKSVVPRAVLFGVVLLAEAWQLWRFGKLIKAVKIPWTEAGFNWLIRKGWRDFLSVFADLLVFVNFLAPIFFTATLAIQKFLIYPLIKKVDLSYAAQILSAVRSIHSVGLPSTFGLTIPAFDQAYRPTTGLGAMWKQSVPAVMSYAIPILLILVLFRLAIPWSLSINRRHVLKRIIVSFLVTEALVKALEFAGEHLLGASEEISLPLQAGVFVLGLLVVLLVDQTLREQKLICPHCGRPNPEGASFCNWCGKAL